MCIAGFRLALWVYMYIIGLSRDNGNENRNSHLGVYQHNIELYIGFKGKCAHYRVI